MAEYNIYGDIAQRTNGSIMLGVVGPVRTGKSTFIKQFMDLLVIPNMDNVYQAQRTRDELPQSAQGRTIMTTEPKFIPDEAVEIELGDNAKFSVRMVDCVGYIVDGSLGYIEDEQPRMVSTPWSDTPIPFNEAAEIGTKKVIEEHSTIGVVITTDGTITEIDREAYIPAESRVISELKALGKPFVVIVNSARPQGEQAQRVCGEIARQHNVNVMCLNCAQLTAEDIGSVMEAVLFEFPLREVRIDMPEWISCLDTGHWLKKSILENVEENAADMNRICTARAFAEGMKQCEYIKRADIDGIELGTGNVVIDIVPEDNLFYRVLGETSGFEIQNERELIKLMKELAKTKSEYDRIAFALHEVREKGYGIVSPSTDELTLDEPKIVKQGGRFGVKLKASAPSIHMIKADIETEVSPIVGTEKQSEELVHYLLQEFETNPSKIWESNIFGKSLYELVNEGLHNKLSKMPDDARMKLRDTLQRIINEGSGGLICIIL